jgi:hypothetical protein
MANGDHFEKKLKVMLLAVSLVCHLVVISSMLCSVDALVVCCIVVAVTG